MYDIINQSINNFSASFSHEHGYSNNPSMMSTKHLLYNKLECSPGKYHEIRLISLKPGHGSQEIECDLLHARLRQEKKHPNSSAVDDRIRILETFWGSSKFKRLPHDEQDRQRIKGRRWVIDRHQFRAHFNPESYDIHRLFEPEEQLHSDPDPDPEHRNDYQVYRHLYKRAPKANRSYQGDSAHQSSATDSYEALSYMWGDVQLTETILINNQEVSVRRNLWSALLHIRQRDRPRLLWVDALCINQDDILERNSQVQLMSKIYSCATGVLSFVGTNTKNVKVALGFIKVLNQAPSNKMLLGYIRHWKYLAYWTAVADLLEREYWKRIWIVQEVAVARNVIIYFGQQTIEWQAISKLYDGLLSLSDDLTPKPYLPKHISKLLITVPAMLHKLRASLFGNKSFESHGWPLQALLRAFHRSLSSDPRDKIYGLFGLQHLELVQDDGDERLIARRNGRHATPQQLILRQRFPRDDMSASERRIVIRDGRHALSQHTIRPDYGKSVFELWGELVRSSDLRDTFQVMYFSQFVQELFGGGDLQTLVPNCAMTTGTSTTKNTIKRKRQKRRHKRKQKRLTAAAGRLTLNHTLPDEQSLVYIPGVCSSAILYLGPPYTGPKASIHLVKKWLDLYFHQVKVLQAERKVPSILLDSIIQAQHDLSLIQASVGVDNSRSYAELGEYSYVSYREKELGGYAEEDLGLGPDGPFGSAAFRSQRANHYDTNQDSEKPRWFISDRGQIGLAPTVAREGDLLCLFQGCDVAVVIRKLGAGKRCELVGRALIMPQGDDDKTPSIRASNDRFRYSIPGEELFRNEFRKDAYTAIEKYRVSLYLDIETLYALTRVSPE